ncbi:10965_t:CDS:1, partial [Funneliformis mosseae]
VRAGALRTNAGAALRMDPSARHGDNLIKDIQLKQYNNHN